MRLNCFRSPSGNSINQYSLDDETLPACKPRPAKRTSTDRVKTRMLRRQGSDSDRASTISTSPSKSSIPPCRKPSDAENAVIQAMMMPVPIEGRPSKCLRLSHPKIYSNIVESMKQSRGCRDWRSFDVFYEDDVDMTRSAVDEARKRKADYEKKWGVLNSFGDDDTTEVEVDMIG
jgi:hypothetical protein